MSAILNVVKAAAGLAVSSVLILTGGTVGADARPAAHQAPARVLQVKVRPTATAAELDTFLTSVKADGGTSVLLPDGRVLWLFGDQVNAAGNGFIGRNAAAVQTGSTFALLPGEFKPSTGGVKWYWPGAAAVDGGRLVVLWGEQTADASLFGSHGSGTVAVTYNASTLKVLSQTATTAAVGGSSVVRKSTGWTVYGTKAVAGSYGKDVLSWTAPLGSLGDLAAWSGSSMVLPASWGAGTDVAVVKEGTHLRLWTKRFDIVGTDVVTATNTNGTWTTPTTVATTGTWTYAVHAHPEQAANVLTYALNGAGAARSGAYHLYTIAAGA